MKKQMKNLKWIGIAALTLTLSSATALAADGGSDGGGGDYSGGKLLDGIEYKDPVKNLRKTYPDAMKIVDERLAAVRKLLPDLADDLEMAFKRSELRWYKSNNRLIPSGAPIKPQVDASDLERDLQQNDGQVLISPAFESKSDTEKARGILHEAVRNLDNLLSARGKHPGEIKIRKITQEIMTLENDEEATEFRDLIQQAGFGTYLTATESEKAKSVIQGARKEICDISPEELIEKVKFESSETAFEVYNKVKTADLLIKAFGDSGTAYPKFEKYYAPDYDNDEMFKAVAVEAANVYRYKNYPAAYRAMGEPYLNLHYKRLIEKRTFVCSRALKDGTWLPRASVNSAAALLQSVNTVNSALEPETRTNLSSVSDRMESGKVIEVARTSVVPSATPGMNGSQAR